MPDSATSGGVQVVEREKAVELADGDFADGEGCECGHVMLLNRDLKVTLRFQAQGGQDVENTGFSSAAQVALLPILPKTRWNLGMTKPHYRGGLTVNALVFSSTTSFEAAPVYRNSLQCAAPVNKEAAEAARPGGRTDGVGYLPGITHRSKVVNGFRP